jgi:hypothetical protein
MASVIPMFLALLLLVGVMVICQFPAVRFENNTGIRDERVGIELLGTETFGYISFEKYSDTNHIKDYVF